MGVARRLCRHPYALGSTALLIVVIVGGTWRYRGHGDPPPGAQGSVPVPPRIPMVAAAARTRDAGVYLNGLGSVTPLKTVTVRSRVGRRADRRPLSGGTGRPQRALLAQIDPRPFEAQLPSAANVMKRDDPAPRAP